MGIVELFSEVPDPRWRNTRHDLGEVLFIALAAVLCGAENCSDMADFARSREGQLREILRLEYGPPSHDTFSRVFRLLEPKGFASVFYRFAEGFAAQAKLEGVVAFDGKSLKRCYERGKRHMPPLMVSAWGAQTRMTLASKLAENGNEVAAVLDLLSLFDLKGAIVTADALHCHRAMAEAVIAAKGDYALAVKANQPALLRDAQKALERAKTLKLQKRPASSTTVKSIGRSLLSTHPIWAAFMTSQVLKRLPASSPSAMAKPQNAYSCSPAAWHPTRCLPLSESIGASRTNSIGSSMSSSTRIVIEPEKTTPLPISQSCADWRSISCGPTQKPKSPSAAKSNVPDGIPPSSSPSSPICDSPAASGEVV